MSNDKTSADKDRTIAVRVPTDLAERIKAAADVEMLTSSAWVRRAVLQALQKHESAVTAGG
tara:strand:+ start:5692 stop:5874 length:183 start_codon:yes stop_codon:yes gene_type:complete